ncbi:MAG TPA: hypothetical protein VI032_01995, partial [Burkholderiaceae bacterium]
SDLDLDLDIGGTVPVLPLDSAVTQEVTRFDAVTRLGAMSLQIDGAPAAHAAAAALLLDRCDALLDALDAWLHTALDWRWIEATPTAAATHPCASAQGAIEGANASVAALTWRLEVPWALLRGLGAPPEVLARRLQWGAVPAVLVVSQPAIDEAELRLLERGGAIVLPESMHAPWQGLLHAPQEDARDGLVVELPGADSVRLGAAQAAARDPAEPTGRPFCEVRMTTTRPLAAEQLAGWAEGSSVELAPRASLWRCAGPSGAERFLAGGRLLPWGDGWAMLIESV